MFIFDEFLTASEPKQAISASKYFVVLDRQNSLIPNIVTQSQQKICSTPL